MKRYIKFPTRDGEPITVEAKVDDEGYDSVKAGRAEDVIERAEETFEEALASLRPATEAVVDHLRDLQPREATVEFGFNLNMESGAVIASAAATANFKVTLKWKPKAPPNSSSTQ
jgi:hypothetical protein